jgi:hypothetical protein
MLMPLKRALFAAISVFVVILADVTYDFASVNVATLAHESGDN